MSGLIPVDALGADQVLRRLYWIMLRYMGMSVNLQEKRNGMWPHRMPLLDPEAVMDISYQTPTPTPASFPAVACVGGLAEIGCTLLTLFSLADVF